MIAYVGTYTIGSESDGIYRFDYDESTGGLSNRTLVATTPNPSFLAIDPTRRLLVCVNEVGDFDDRPTGAISSFTIEEDLSLSRRHTIPSHGRAPCFVSLCDDTALVANYVEGTVASFRVSTDGRFQHLHTIRHEGTGPNVERQECAHAHSITPFPNGRFAVAADLGTDEVITYALSKDGLRKSSVAKESPGAGPRHVTFSKCGTRLIVLNELNSTLSLHRLDQNTGELARVQTESTLPDGWKGDNICADVHLSPDGRFVYCSNRGHESLAVFRLNFGDDSLDRIQVTDCGGEHPRNFALSADGRFLLCANQNTHEIVTFTADPDNGRLAITDLVAPVPMPVCICWVDETALP